jgi:hypothetical protein
LGVCQVLDESADLEGKRVVVRGTYRYGFEWQEIYCLRCAGIGRIWVEWRDDDSATKALEHLPKGAGTANVVVTGRVVFGGSYGHMGAYWSQLEDAEVLSASLVERSGAVPNALPQQDRARVCQE